ncbi:MAG: hypothetical protein HY735_15750, partial [Verrucomicrobia bacterium]|nr:hypothetical protein [Verrucomicrobiota bacterium]
MKENPFDRSMFDSQAYGSTVTTFMLVLVGALLLLIILYAVKSFLRRRNAGLDLDDVADRNHASVRRGFFGNVVTIVSGKRPVHEMALSHLVEFDPPSVNCSIVQTEDGRDANEDAGRGDTLALDYFSRSPLDGSSAYYEMVCQVIKG